MKRRGEKTERKREGTVAEGRKPARARHADKIANLRAFIPKHTGELHAMFVYYPLCDVHFSCVV